MQRAVRELAMPATVLDVLKLSFVSFGLCIAIDSGAMAQTAPTPVRPQTPPAVATQAPKTSVAHEVVGFRSARFGMTEAEVRSAVGRDFATRADQVRENTNAVERTRSLVVALDRLEPGPGPATVVYIFGHRTQRLIQVNVIWARAQGATTPEEAAFVVAGVQLTTFFQQHRWRDGSVAVGAPIGPNSVLLFGGEDAGTGAVQLVIDGVALEAPSPPANGGTPPRPANLTPSLRVNYIANRGEPDVFRIERGRF
jgi:hypothetical protein